MPSRIGASPPHEPAPALAARLSTARIRRRRLIVLNNYDLTRVETEVARGEKPAHHLFGLDALRRAGWSIEIVPQDAGAHLLRWADGWLARSRWPVPLGSLAQQYAAWRQLRRGDVIYSPCQTQSHLFGYARALELGRFSLVTLAHHPLRQGRLQQWRNPFLRWQLAGTAAFPALSRTVAAEIQQASGRGEAFAPAIGWGPELSYYDAYRGAGPGRGVAAAGRTGRDWATLAAGATRAGMPAEIFLLGGAQFSAPPGVVVHHARDESDFPYPQLLPALARARVHAIPLEPGTALSGLTSLIDALGLGKPVVMTRHPLIDLDLEAEGIGRWVAPGDIAGWTEALQWFERHPAEAEAMGRRARALAEQRLNYPRFCTAISRLLEAALAA